ncbi:hypothetical protein ACFVHB_37320 [Kitasatospora sp. NPDC127111]|uniref:hypothetical protein n=1 Tax=Kitasatospora sp. NPDC127111 TaxID=3345363 RepID=UPI003626D1EF
MAEVEAAIVRLESGPQPLSPTLRGALAAYEWAAGHRHAAPVSGAQQVGNRPQTAQLKGEQRAALRATDNRTDLGPQEHDFALGVVRALAWLIGYSADPP